MRVLVLMDSASAVQRIADPAVGELAKPRRRAIVGEAVAVEDDRE
jgi:hypothetical protein